MSILKMVISLIITLLVIIKVNNNKKLIIPICIFYYFGNVIIDIFLAGTPVELGNVLGVSYQWGDIILLVFVGVILLDIILNPKIYKTKINLILTVIIALVFYSMGMGLVNFGLTAQWIGDFRTFFIFISAIIFFIRFDILKYIYKYIKLIDICMNIILVISIILWAIDLLFGFHPLVSQYNATLSDGGSTMRFIQSYQVLGIAIYVLYLIRKDIYNNQIISARTTIFSIAIILFQHRSVWVAFGAGILIEIFCICKTNKLSLKLLLQGYLIIFSAILIMFYGSGDITKNIRGSFILFTKVFTGKTLENTTASTRVMVWDAVKADLSGIATVIGRPFGYGYATSIGWENSPHGGYIRILGRTGYVGLLITGLASVYLFIKSYLKNIKYIPEFLICISVFMYTYDFTWISGVVLGCAITVIQRNKARITEK